MMIPTMTRTIDDSNQNDDDKDKNDDDNDGLYNV